MKGLFFAILAAALVTTPAISLSETAGALPPANVDRGWWLRAPEAQRETFILGAIAAYQVGRNDAYYAILAQLHKYPEALTAARSAVPLVRFPRPASFYAQQIDRFYSVAPASLQSTWPSTILFCLADGVDPERVMMCRKLLASTALVTPQSR